MIFILCRHLSAARRASLKTTGVCLLFQCKIVDGDIGRCLASLKIEEEHTNRVGGLHGGISAILVDDISTLALVHPEQPYNLGRVYFVRLEIHITDVAAVVRPE